MHFIQKYISIYLQLLIIIYILHCLIIDCDYMLYWITCI